MQVVPSLERIEDAASVIDPVFLNTPQFELDALNYKLGCRLVLKVETLNPIRSFKGRGATWLVARLRKGQSHSRSRALSLGLPLQVVCASAGNFGQGMAYACQQVGMALTVFAAETANPLKLERMRDLGAEVRLAGQDFDAAKTAARAYAAEHGLTFIEDAKDIETAEGAGTMALELLHYPEQFAAVLVPLGNGAMINGVGACLKAKGSGTKIIGVVAEGAPAMDLSWRRGEVVTTEKADTIADGIGVRLPVPEALEAMTTTVDDIVQVSDDDILAAMRLAHKAVGLVLEPAGAVGLAAAFKYRTRFKGQLLATILCGGNLTEAQMRRWL